MLQVGFPDRLIDKVRQTPPENNRAGLYNRFVKMITIKIRENDNRWRLILSTKQYAFFRIFLYTKEMAETELPNQREVRAYIENAFESLKVADLNLRNDFYSSAVNRAYYAILYAANAVLATQGLARSKHTGVISVFRSQFVKTGEFTAEMSKIYGDLMELRQQGDYDMISDIEPDEAREALQNAEIFVKEVEAWLKRNHWR